MTRVKIQENDNKILLHKKISIHFNKTQNWSQCFISLSFYVHACIKHKFFDIFLEGLYFDALNATIAHLLLNSLKHHVNTVINGII